MKPSNPNEGVQHDPKAGGEPIERRFEDMRAEMIEDDL